jgi:hypothetical protein
MNELADFAIELAAVNSVHDHTTHALEDRKYTSDEGQGFKDRDWEECFLHHRVFIREIDYYITFSSQIKFRSTFFMALRFLK